ncbi:hypothetical protein BE20_07940 [Sorangium cellulosum]|nr:hypothetical protein BE20_07940 [Sorangium cellulosum]
MTSDERKPEPPPEVNDAAIAGSNASPKLAQVTAASSQALVARWTRTVLSTVLNVCESDRLADTTSAPWGRPERSNRSRLRRSPPPAVVPVLSVTPAPSFQLGELCQSTASATPAGPAPRWIVVHTCPSVDRPSAARPTPSSPAPPGSAPQPAARALVTPAHNVVNTFLLFLIGRDSP